MFCPKCGAKALDGAGFCQKCGAKLIEDASVQPAASDSTNSIQMSGKISEAVPKKKKSKKLLIILAVVFAFIVILIAANTDDLAEKGEQDKKDTEYIQSLQTSADVDLSETYTNEDEGISFKYPGAWSAVNAGRYNEWFHDSQIPLVVLANENKDIPENNTYILVSKFEASQEDIEYLFCDDAKFAESFKNDAGTTSGDDLDIKETSVIELDNVPARMLVASSGDIGFRVYFYFANSNIYRVEFCWIGKTSGDNQRCFDAVIGSYRITAAETANADNLLLPLTVSSDAEKVFQEWESTHPLGEYYHLDLISDDETDSEGNKVFLFTLETGGAGIFNMTIRKSDGYMEYIEKSGSMSMDEWYGEWFGAGDIVSGYQEPIENYWRLSGSYNGSTDMSTLSLSIYSFQEEGETAVGNVVIYTDNGKDYTGTVTPIGENVYKVAAGTGEEVLLIESVSGDAIVLQLYVDGEYLEEYRMKEHYES